MQAPTRRLLLIGVVCAAVLVLGGGALFVVQDRVIRGCTKVGGDSVVTIRANAAVRAELSTVRVTLRQGDEGRGVEFPPAGTNKYGMYIERGVTIANGRYWVSLDHALGGSWKADDRATVTVTGLGRDGAAHFRHEESFRFDKYYPNGKGCEPEVLGHATSLDEGDRVS